MSKPKCKPNDWNKWANSQCEFAPAKAHAARKLAHWTRMKDWSWNQIDGWKGEDRVISEKPIVLLAQQYDGSIVTRIIQMRDKPVTLKNFGKALNSLFAHQNGDQSLTEIRIVGTQKQPALVVWLFFDS